MVTNAAIPSLLSLFLILLLLLSRGLLLVTVRSYQNLTAGSSLSSFGPNSSLSSPSGDFAFGFWPLDTNPSLFLLVVWFNTTSPQVVVWFATNGTSPVQLPAKSTLHLTQAGQLSLSDPTGQEVWSPDATNTRTNTAIRGTKGYVAPEWFKNSAITAKVDVYSFGVLLLEIVCCRKNVQTKATTEEAAVLTYWAYDCFRDGRLDLLVDGDEEAMMDVRRVERFVMVAIWCIQEEPSLRPSMRKVAEILRLILLPMWMSVTPQ